MPVHMDKIIVHSYSFDFRFNWWDCFNSDNKTSGNGTLHVSFNSFKFVNRKQEKNNEHIEIKVESNNENVNINSESVTQGNIFCSFYYIIY